MNKFERVLSDVELTIAINDGCTADLFALAERVEQAVLAKLAEQEPVAWRVHPFDYGVGVEGAYALTQQEDMKEVWERKSWEVTPLYTQPLPCVAPTSDKTACVPENAESDTQHHLEYIKRYQKWRRGEDKTMSEMGLAPKQIGEALDWLIGVVEDHIVDVSKMVFPDGWQLTPTQATNDMYMGFCHVRNDIEPDEFREAYRAMLEAAPKPTP